MSADPLAIAIRIASVLESLGTRYVLGGSLASVAFGEPRATLDVDIAADLQPERVTELMAAVEADFFADADWIAQEVRRRGSFQLVHRESMMRVDVFVPEWTGLHLWKWEHRRRIEVDAESGAQIDVTAPEGIVIQKLTWFRTGGELSDRQWRDVLGVLKNQGTQLDLAAMKEQASLSDVRDLLERALREAGLQPG